MEIDPKKTDFNKMFEAPAASKAISNPAAGPENPESDSFAKYVPGHPDEGGGISNFGSNVFNTEKLLGGKKLFDMSLDMFKERMGKFLALIVVIVLTSIAMDLIIFFPLGFITDPKAILNYNVVYLYLVFSALSIVVSIPSIILSISILETIKDGNLPVKEALSRSFGKFKNYILSQIIGVLMYAGIILIVPAITVIQIINSIQSSTFSFENFNPSFLLFGFIIIFPLIFIVEVWMFISILGVVLENLSPFESFSYGYELIKGKAGTIFWRMFSLSWRLAIYAIIIQFLFGATVGVFVGTILAISGNNKTVFEIISYLYNYLDVGIQLCITSFALVYQYNIYENLKALKKDLPEDYKVRHKNMIRVLLILGVLLLGMLLSVLIYYAPSIDQFVKKEVMTEEFMKKNGLAGDPAANVSGLEKEDIKTDNEKKSSEPTENEKMLARDSKRKDDVERISQMIFGYKEINGSFPLSPAISKLNEENDVVSGIRSASGAEIPLDPKNPEYYYGYISSEGTAFELSARLENVDDPACDPGIKSICLYKLRF